MADKDPEELKVRVGDNTYPFPSFDTLDYVEARRIKKETDGLVMGQFFEALDIGDPDAMFAVALIVKLREDPRFNPDELNHLKLSDIELILPESEPEVLDDSPLAEKPDASPPSNDDKTSDEPPPPVETPSPS